MGFNSGFKVLTVLIVARLGTNCVTYLPNNGIHSDTTNSFGLNGCHLNQSGQNFAKNSPNRNVCLLVINQKTNASIIYSIRTGPPVCLNEPIRNKQGVVTKV